MIDVRSSLIVLGLAGTALIGGCTSSETADAGSASSTGAAARASLYTPAGVATGEGRITQVSGGLRLTVDASATPPGIHGIHVHTTGKCEAPDFQTAGGHWNPTGHQHGRENPQGAHTGDLPNITIGADGRGSLSFELPGATLAGLLDADGSALIIHAAPDDFKTDPSGNSGARISCGVFAAG